MLGKSESPMESGKGSELIGRKGSLYRNEKKVIHKMGQECSRWVKKKLIS